MCTSVCVCVTLHVHHPVDVHIPTRTCMCITLHTVHEVKT